MELVKTDDYKCFKCGKILSDLFRYRLASTAIDKAKYSVKVEKNLVMVLSKGERIYRHRRKCEKKE